MITIVLALIRRKGRFFLQRRDPGNPVLPGLWEFPGGKVEVGEDLEEALRRELLEELAWIPERLEARPSVSHAYPHGTVVLHPFWCEGPTELCTDLGWGWFRVEEITHLPIPNANRSLLAALALAESRSMKVDDAH